MDERILEIVIRARNEASAVLKQVGNDTENLTNFFEKNMDKAALMATGVVGSLGLVGKAMVDQAAAMEQNRVAFETFLGSGEKAGKLLKQLSDFAVKTPFEMPQVIEGAKRLLAFGVTADQIIPTFKTLGDIASGIGKDKLPDLIHAFGQVTASTKLTGRELNEFTMAGVPLLQAITDQLNKTAGAAEAVGTAHKKTKIDIEHVNAEIEIQNKKMQENAKHFKTGSSAYMQAQEHLRVLHGELDKANQSTVSFGGSTKYTVEQVKKMADTGKITAEQVKAALEGMTDKGGRFYNLMDKQSHTFSGTMTNLKDEITRFSLALVGMTEEGEIRKGSLFYYLHIGAAMLLDAVTKVRPVAVAFFDSLLKNKSAVEAIAGALLGLVALMAVAFITTFGGAIIVMTTFAALGAGIAIVVNQLVDRFGGWQKVLNTFSSVFSNVNNLVQHHKTLLEGIVIVLGASLIPSIAKLGIELGVNLAGNIAKSIVAIVQWIAEGWKMVAVTIAKTVQLGIASAAFITHAIVVGASTIATAALTVATWALNIAIAILTSPITLVILAIIALIAIVVLLVTHWNIVKQKALEVWATVSQAWQGLMVDVHTAIDSMMKKIDEWHTGIETAVNNVIGFFKKLADGVMAALQSIKFPHLAIGEGHAKILGKDIGYPTFNVDWYEHGGFVPSTGLAMLHAGEFVLSRDMLSGRMGVPQQIQQTTKYNQPINIYANINSQMDLNLLGYKIGFAVRNSR